MDDVPVLGVGWGVVVVCLYLCANVCGWVYVHEFYFFAASFLIGSVEPREVFPLLLIFLESFKRRHFSPKVSLVCLV